MFPLLAQAPDPITWQGGALAVITVLGGVVSILFWLNQSSMKRELAFLREQNTKQQNEIDEVKAENQRLTQLYRDTPNPRFCTVHNCPLRPVGTGTMQMTLSVGRKQNPPSPDDTPQIEI